MSTRHTLRNGLADAFLLLALTFVYTGCTDVSSSYPPNSTRETKLEGWVTNLSVPGAPRNTAYRGGRAEVVGYLRGTGTHVAFFFPGGTGWPSVVGLDVAVDSTTGATTYGYTEWCGDYAYQYACLGLDGWFYQRVDQMGHARIPFHVGYHFGYYDILARPVVITGNGTVGHKLEFEEKIRVYFSNDMYGYYD
ncbi:MAG: hypothetical protein OEZ32_08030 [Nitrospinota bacterium]|nr:hypothetical protein [Nitrospinota bacterium]